MSLSSLLLILVCLYAELINLALQERRLKFYQHTNQRTDYFSSKTGYAVIFLFTHTSVCMCSQWEWVHDQVFSEERNTAIYLIFD